MDVSKHVQFGPGLTTIVFVGMCVLPGCGGGPTPRETAASTFTPTATVLAVMGTPTPWPVLDLGCQGEICSVAQTPTAIPVPRATATTDRPAIVTPTPAVALSAVQAFVLDPTGTRLTYAIDQVWLEEDNRVETITGGTDQVAGRITLDLDDPATSGLGVFSADLAGFTSADAERDQVLRQMWQQAGRFPLATFVGSELQGFPETVRMGEPVPFQLLGDLTLGGATQPVTWGVTATLDGEHLHGVAVTRLRLDDFGLPVPEVPGLLRAGDVVTVSLEFTFKADEQLPASGHG